jgi:hypothetical protein
MLAFLPISKHIYILYKIKSIKIQLIFRQLLLWECTVNVIMIHDCLSIPFALIHVLRMYDVER